MVPPAWLLMVWLKPPDSAEVKAMPESESPLIRPLLVIVVVAAAIVVALRAIRGAGRPLAEDETVPSRIFGPSGLIATPAEREVQKQWDALPSSHAKSVGTSAH